MTIVNRLLLTLGVALLGLIAVGANGLYQQQAASKLFEDEINNVAPSVRDLNAATYAFIKVRGAVIKGGMTEAGDLATRQIAAGDAEEAAKQIADALAKYEKNDIFDDRDRALLNDDKAKAAALQDELHKFFGLLASGNQDVEARKQGQGPLRSAGNELRAALEKHVEYNLKLAFDSLETNKRANTAATVQALAIIGVVLLILAYMSFTLVRTIGGGLAGIRSTLQTVSQSLDFTQRAKDDGKDEISQTAAAFNALLERLQDNLRSILDGAKQVASSAQALAQTASQVAATADSQSASSASMASTIEQMTVSVNHVAVRAEESRSLAENAGSLASQGSQTISQTIHDIHEISQVVDRAADSIRELDSYSAKVDSVVSMIKDIADQTNLLALNAAIEAARAGESGRGFAVVADEVRKLAERTSAATQEISDTINAMRDRSRQATEQMQNAEALVRNGVNRADEADHSIQQIGSATGNTVHMAAEISDAIKEQGHASNNIAAQVERVAQMTEESSAAAQEVAASARRLDELARQQIATLDSYRL
jgi:methyl-accepting chemotaxis protein